MKFIKKNTKMRKKLTIWICLIAMIVGITGGYSVAYAVEESDFDDLEDVAQQEWEEFAAGWESFGEDVVDCAKGFPKFMASMIDPDNFAVYWVDVFTKNMCLLTDIFEVDDEVDELQQAIRSSYYSCNLEDMTELETEYKKARMELYFLRNLIYLDPKTINSMELDEVVFDIETYVDLVLIYDMYTMYVEEKGWIDDVPFIEHYDYLKDKYVDQIPDYLSCTDNAWQEVVDKVEELKEVFESLKPDPDKEKEPLIPEDFEMAKPSVKFTPSMSFESEFVKSIAQFVGVVAEVQTEFFKQGLTASGEPKEDEESVAIQESMNIVDLFDYYVEDAGRYDTEVVKAELLAKYKLLYGQGGADIADALAAKIRQLYDGVDVDGDGSGDEGGLKATANIVVKGIQDKTYDIAKKQCKD